MEAITLNGKRFATTEAKAETRGFSQRIIEWVHNARSLISRHHYAIEIVGLLIVGTISVMSLARGTREMAGRIAKLEVAVQEAIKDRAEILAGQKRIETGIERLEKAVEK